MLHEYAVDKFLIYKLSLIADECLDGCLPSLTIVDTHLWSLSQTHNDEQTLP